MTDGLKWTVNEVPKSDDTYLELMSEANVQKANEFHKSFPQYTVTPLQKLSALASFLGVKNIYCKDESYRFGLNAFKVLGGSYAMGRSEEHTSELQSRFDLVCRLLLEKKKK